MDCVELLNFLTKPLFLGPANQLYILHCKSVGSAVIQANILSIDHSTKNYFKKTMQIAEILSYDLWVFKHYNLLGIICDYF